MEGKRCQFFWSLFFSKEKKRLKNAISPVDAPSAGKGAVVIAALLASSSPSSGNARERVVEVPDQVADHDALAARAEDPERRGEDVVRARARAARAGEAVVEGGGGGGVWKV